MLGVFESLEQAATQVLRCRELGCKKLINWALKLYFPDIKKKIINVPLIFGWYDLFQSKDLHKYFMSFSISFLVWLIISIALELHHHKDYTCWDLWSLIVS